MAEAIKGHTLTIEVSADNVTYTVLTGVKSWEDSNSKTELDTTAFSDTSAYKDFCMGLVEGANSFEMQRIQGDAGQGIVKTGFDNNTPVYFRILYDGTNGSVFHTEIGSMTNSADVDGLVMTSVSLKTKAAPVDV